MAKKIDKFVDSNVIIADADSFIISIRKSICHEQAWVHFAHVELWTQKWLVSSQFTAFVSAAL